MRRLLLICGFSTVGLMTAAFRCPGPDPQGDPDPLVGGGGSGTGGRGVGGSQACVSEPDEDFDDDGWTVEAGDCDDCDASVHPGAAELPTRSGDAAVDENCDGQRDERLTCAPANAGQVTAAAAAHAIELCDVEGEREWGLEDAEFVGADGSTASLSNSIYQPVALAKQFGPAWKPQAGTDMLVLSTGHAAPGPAPASCEPDGCGDTDSVQAPPSDYPVTLPGCEAPQTIYDDIGLEVTIKPPPNAGGFSFRTAYFTREYPQSICSPYVDQFLALRLPKPAGWLESNMVFDGREMPPSVSFQPFPHCEQSKSGSWADLCQLAPTACPEPPGMFCPEGAGLLAGTGFSEGASTGWLETTVPLVNDEEFKIRFVIFDTGNIERDSTVLIDGFTWLGPRDFGSLPVTEAR